MKTIRSLLFIFVVLRSNLIDSTLSNPDEWLEWFNRTMTLESGDNVIANWHYETNITDANLEVSTKSDAHLLALQINAADNASAFLKQHTELKPTTKRLLTKISKIGLRLDDQDALMYSKIKGNMTAIYSKSTICSMDNKTLKMDCNRQWKLTPDLDDVFRISRSYDQLLYAWKMWHENTGRPVMPLYKEFVEVSNKGARSDGFADTGDYWRSLYEDPEFTKTLENLWYEILPLYEQMHTYIRKKLRDRYSNRFTTSAIPAHILGNMWAQDWSNIADIAAPYPNKSTIDVTEAMKTQNYNPSKIHHTADTFFTSMGMIPLPDIFWKKSLIERPSDGREVVCHASAWDFYRFKDVRIKMCTQVEMEDLIVVHHEQGHIQYYLQYAHQPFTFRDGANPGFHEAIGDTIALSVSTPEYLKKIGLLKDYTPDEEQDLNNLFKIASTKIAFLPFGYLIDQWRWAVFNESVPYDEWNEYWWVLRYKYQGVVPPVDRVSGKDFDPGAKFHVPSNSAYLQYFVAHILQFQFYEAMCKASGHSGPLHHCNFFNKTSAGELFGKMLKLGSSVHWKEALQIMTGGRDMSAGSVIRYFEPLMKWMEKQNEGECFGWGYEWPSEVSAKLKKPRCNP